NGVNMTKLESYMIEGNFFATQFYADVEGHPEDRSLVLALEELAFFSKGMKILGVYPAPPFPAPFEESPDLAPLAFAGRRPPTQAQSPASTCRPGARPVAGSCPTPCSTRSRSSAIPACGKRSSVRAKRPLPRCSRRTTASLASAPPATRATRNSP